jgi:hypothetical protein
MTTTPHLYVALLHDKMVDKTGRLVTTSVTLIDTHDISRSCRTYGAESLFVVHPAQTVRALVRTIKEHWDTGFGSTYNPNRQDALGRLSIVSELDEAILQIEQRTGKLPKLIATSARDGDDRITYAAMKEILSHGEHPINGPTEYNHLSVRAACAIILDRLLGV